MIALTLTIVVVLIQLLGFINHNLIANLGFYNIMKLIFLESIPILFYISPIALVCSILYLYNSLAIDHELIMLEASGISKYEIAKPTIIFAVGLMFIGYMISMFIDPLSKRALVEHKNNLINSSIFSTILEEKVFNKISKNLIVYLDHQDQQNQLHGIAIYDHRIPSEQFTIFAEKAEIINDKDNIIFKLYNGSRQDIQKNSLRMLYFNSLSWPVSIDKLYNKNRSISLGEKIIFHLIWDKIKDAAQDKKLTQEINHRLAYPLLNFVLACVSLATLFSGSFDRRWKIKRTARSAIFAVLTFAVIITLKTKDIQSVAFIFLVYISVVLISYCSLYVLRKNSEGIEIIPSNIKKKLPRKLQWLFL